MKISKSILIFLTVIMPLLLGVGGSYITTKITMAEIKIELRNHKEQFNKFEKRVDKKFDKLNKITDKIFSDLYKPHISMAVVSSKLAPTIKVLPLEEIPTLKPN